MTRPDPALRGKCEEYSRALCERDPSLTLVRGWYHDLVWGREEHWWCKREDGTIVDPTSAQFPVGGVTALYEEYRGVFPCYNCGDEVVEGEDYMGCCGGRCYGYMVGVY